MTWTILSRAERQNGPYWSLAGSSQGHYEDCSASHQLIEYLKPRTLGERNECSGTKEPCLLSGDGDCDRFQPGHGAHRQHQWQGRRARAFARAATQVAWNWQGLV